MRLFVQLPPHTNPGEQEPYARAPYNFVPLPEVAVAAVDDAENLPGHDSYAHERFPYTGYFDVILTTRSPLYVRCPITRQAFDRDEQEKDVHGRRVDAHTRYADRVKNTPHFFYTHTPQHPVIPGSSLRGMLRNLLEIVSHGKLTKVTDKRLVYRAVGDRTALGTWYREQTLGANQASLPDMHFDYPSPRLKGGYLCRYQGEWAIRPAQEHLGESFVHVEYSAARGVGIRRVDKHVTRYL